MRNSLKKWLCPNFSCGLKKSKSPKFDEPSMAAISLTNSAVMLEHRFLDVFSYFPELFGNFKAF